MKSESPHTLQLLAASPPPLLNQVPTTVKAGFWVQEFRPKSSSSQLVGTCIWLQLKRVESVLSTHAF